MAESGELAAPILIIVALILLPLLLVRWLYNKTRDYDESDQSAMIK